MLHRNEIPADGTIVAIASGRGTGGRCVVRISGPDSLKVATLAFGVNLESAQRGKLVPAKFQLMPVSGDTAATAIPVAGQLLVWPDSRSYTGQPSVEFHTSLPHPVIDQLVASCCRHGARLAMPGEFTLRGFLAGRFDLTQAEAVLGLIHARTDREFSTALSQLAGGLAIPFSEIRETLLTLLADLEAGLDFVEDDIEFIDRERLATSLTAALTTLRRLQLQMASRSATGTDHRVVLAGLPNSGKSSLFNVLAGGNPAIVSDLEGTTRDWLSQCIRLGPWTVNLIDTAGVEHLDLPPAAVEPAGFLQDPFDPSHTTNRMSGEMTRTVVAQANLVIFCIDTSRAGMDREFVRAANFTHPTLVIQTKSDLAGSTMPIDGVIATSSRTGSGLDELRQAIIEKLGDSSQNVCETVPATLLRCSSSLQHAVTALQETLDALEAGFGDEIVAAGLRESLDYIGSISGDVCTDDILDRIFSRFCIGK